MFRFKHLVAAAAAASLFTAPAQAQELTGTLKKIKDTGTDHHRPSRGIDPVLLPR